MLARFKDEIEKHVVTALVIGQVPNKTYLHFSMLGNSQGQYPQSLNEVEIIDPTIPGNWIVAYDKRQDELIITFPEWANDIGESGKPGFYERYTDGEPDALSVMKHYYDIECEKYKNEPDLFEGKG